MTKAPIEKGEIQFFTEIVFQNYESNSILYTTISRSDIKSFIDRVANYKEGAIYDPLVEPLVLSSLAHFLYHKRNGMENIELNAYHPNYIRLDFLDKLVASKASLTVSYLQYIEFAPCTSSIDKGLVMSKIDKILVSQTLKILVESFIKKLPVDRISEVIKKKRSPTRGLGILYFLLLDLYLEEIDLLIYDCINKLELTCFWARCLNIGLLVFTNPKPKAVKEMELLQLDIILPSWGLTAKARSAAKGGIILRPLKGKLSINKEGHLQWDRPESIIADL